MRTVRRVGPVPAYVLHQAPYRDSGRILELLTQDHGRLSVFAHGVRRAKSGLVAALQPFQRLLVSWSGRGEAPSLAGAELDGPPRSLPAAQFVSACYVNELILKLTTRHDSHAGLFDLYDATLAALNRGEGERALRLFEKRLLDLVGFGLALGVIAGGHRPIDPAAHYHFRLEHGAVEAGPGAAGRVYSGAALLALAREQLDDDGQVRALKPLLRDAIEACLEGRTLSTREVAMAMRRKRSGGSKE
ncbi:MAG TPA: DNA repair protein RecO [Steroidobacteraceae bacterium]|nr:DNA repair protein RecO [Steroidobacteraceae bacterium]